MRSRPGGGLDQFRVRRLQRLQIRRVVAAELIDGRVELEVDLVEPADEADRQMVAEPSPTQSLRQTPRQTEAIESAIATAGAVVQPIAGKAEVIGPSARARRPSRSRKAVSNCSYGCKYDSFRAQYAHYTKHLTLGQGMIVVGFFPEFNPAEPSRLCFLTIDLVRLG